MSSELNMVEQKDAGERDWGEVRGGTDKVHSDHMCSHPEA